MPQFETSSKGYGELWNTAHTRSESKPRIDAAVRTIEMSKARYETAQAKTGVPWFMIAALHFRESSNSFSKHLHNGDPLSARTKHVPAGRPVSGTPPFQWEMSAFDALTMPPHSLNKVPRWSCERILYETEKYNGFGYIGKTNSPYVWSGTDQYAGGMYVADHDFSKSAFDPRPGCAPIIRALAAKYPDVARRMDDREPKAPKDVKDEQVRNRTEVERTATKAGAAVGGAGGVTKATVETPSTTQAPVKGVVMGYVVPIGIGLAVAIVIVAAISMFRKWKVVPKEVQQKWEG